MKNMKTAKKTTNRTCCGCGQIFDKKELIRVVRTPEGAVILDSTGKANGRGAYLCRKTECLARARKTKRLAASLKTTIEDSVYEALEARMEEYERQ